MKIKLGDLKRILREEFMLAEKFKSVGPLKRKKGSMYSGPASVLATDVGELEDPEDIAAFQRGEDVGFDLDDVEFDFYGRKGEKTMRPKMRDDQIPSGFRMRAGQSQTAMRSELGKLSRDILEPVEAELNDSGVVSTQGPSKRSLMDMSLGELQAVVSELEEMGEEGLAGRVKSAALRIMSIKVGF